MRRISIYVVLVNVKEAFEKPNGPCPYVPEEKLSTYQMFQKLCSFSLSVNRQIHKLFTDGSQTVHERTDKSFTGYSSKIDLTVCRLSMGRAMSFNCIVKCCKLNESIVYGVQFPSIREEERNS